MTWKSRIAALLLALCCLTAALTGCGKKQTDTAAPIDQPTQTQTAPEPVDDYEPTKGDKPYYVRVNLQAGTCCGSANRARTRSCSRPSGSRPSDSPAPC